MPAYSAANQMTVMQTSHPEYMYDSSRPEIPPQQDYTVNGLNQYETVVQTGGTTSLTYDANANLTGDGTWAYSYDAVHAVDVSMR